MRYGPVASTFMAKKRAPDAHSVMAPILSPMTTVNLKLA